MYHNGGGKKYHNGLLDFNWSEVRAREIRPVGECEYQVHAFYSNFSKSDLVNTLLSRKSRILPLWITFFNGLALFS